ncbi:MAG: methyl-accepting chemotaxis protein [Dethiosulfovibrio sp.]|nr:methyl-accepting chemotaxis protein [Dethiosulfovibrio sp.]
MKRKNGAVGLTVGFQVSLVVGVLIVSLLTVVIGVASFRSGKMMEESIDQGGLGFVESLQVGVAQEIRSLREANHSYVNTVVQRLDGKMTFENEDLIPVGEMEVNKFFVMDGSLQQITGDMKLVDEWHEAMGSQFSIYQVIEGGMVRVSTTMKDQDGVPLLGSFTDSSSPRYVKTVKEGQGHDEIVSVMGSPHVGYYRPVKDNNGEVKMVIFAGTSLLPAQSRVVKSSLGEGSYGAIFDSQGRFVAHPTIPDGSSLSEATPDLWRALTSSGILSSSSPTEVSYEYNGRNSKAYIQKIDGTDWFAMVIVDADLAMAPVRSMKIGLVLWTVPLALLGLVVLGIAVMKLISPLRKVVEIAGRIAEGDLSMAISARENSVNEIDRVMEAFGRILEEYRQLVKKVVGMNAQFAEGAKVMSDIAQETHDALSKVDEATEAVASMVDSIAASAEETNAGVEEVSSGVASSTQVVTELSEKAQSVSSNAEQGRRAVDDVSKGTSRAGDATSRVISAMEELERSVGGITGFVNTIVSIADQTNLLALNAAIEAARAGEAGRGFAVVAEEVRKLAEESNSAASNIRKVIETVQSDMAVAAKDTREAGSVMEDLLNRSTQAAEEIKGATDGVAAMAEGIQSIAASSEEQAASTQEIARAVDTIASMLSGGRESAQDMKDATDRMGIKLRELKAIRISQQEKLVELRELTDNYRLEETSSPAVM